MDIKGFLTGNEKLCAEITADAKTLETNLTLVAASASVANDNPEQSVAETARFVVQIIVKIVKYFRWAMPKSWKTAVDLFIAFADSLFPPDEPEVLTAQRKAA
jgi:hypothetical protein